MKAIFILIITTLTFFCCSIKKSFSQCLKISDGIPVVFYGCEGESSYPLVFEDNFNGTSLDLTKWRNIEYQQGFFGNEINVYYTLNNVEVSGGTCKIRTKKENVYERAIDWRPDNYILDDGLQNKRWFPYTSGNISTKQMFGYGVYEARVKIPVKNGLWPAFWTYGHEENRHEIDIFEIMANNWNKTTWNTYKRQPWGVENCGGSYNFGSTFLNDRWVIYTMIYEPDYIEWKLNGNTLDKKYHYTNIFNDPFTCGESIPNSARELKSFPNDIMSIIFNTAVYSNEHAPNPVGFNTPTMEIDYVRYYAKHGHCTDCYSNMTYENINRMPYSTNANDYIIAKNNARVDSAQIVNFKAGNEINLEPGFSTANGAEFSALITSCTIDSYEFSKIAVIDHPNEIPKQFINRCSSESLFYLDVVGAKTYYVVIVMQLPPGYESPTWIGYTGNSNLISLFDTQYLYSGFQYKVYVTLDNCYDKVFKTYDLTVSGSCMVLEDNSEMASIKRVDNNSEIVLSTDESEMNTMKFESDYVLYPNPAIDKLHITYSRTVNINENAMFSIVDLSGRVLMNEQYKLIEQDRTQTIDIGNLPEGVYVLKVQNNSVNISKQFIVLRR